MLMATVFTAIYTVACIFLFNYAITNKHIKINFKILPLCVVFAFILRIILAYTNLGHKTDMSCFSAWADILYRDGFSSFYTSEVFCDYPPGYMYILRFVGFIKSLYSYTAGQVSVILKMPAMLCDIIMGIFIYRTAKKKLSETNAQLIALFYLFNPAVIVNSAIWGQVDSVYLLPLVTALLFIGNSKIILSFIAFALAVIFKPQSLIFTPVFLFGAWEYIKDSESKKHSIITLIIGLLSALCAALLLILPFGIKNTLMQYIDTLASYSYATVNAFNLWGLLGMNWQKLNLATKIIGYAFILLICIGAGFVYFRGEKRSRHFTTAAFLGFSTYMLTVKMHERYAFCAIALMLLAFCFDGKRKGFLAYLLLTISQILNVAWVYFVYEKNPSAYYQSIYINIASALNIILLVYMCFLFMGKRDSALFKAKITAPKEDSPAKDSRCNRYDILAMVVITLVYSAVALINLGDTKAPESGYQLMQGEQVDIAFDNEYSLGEMRIYPQSVPVDNNNQLTVRFFDGEDNLSETKTLTDCEVFAWHFEALEGVCARHIVITAQKDTFIGELSFFDTDLKMLTPQFSSSSELFDESSLVPQRESHLNSTYFDEIYHARTAYEFIHGLDVYEWTHPPLGKIFISFGIRLFGMNPFGWRIMGVIFGILMLPFIYMFSKRLFKKSWLSVVLTIAFAFDFMHFVQTRIATIDVYITFFVILMYYFMYSYYQMSFYNQRLYKTLVPLFFCGICFGLGVACKWTGIYAGAGLCVIFFMTIHKRYREYLYAKTHSDEDSCRNIITSFGKNTVITLAFCVGAFVVIPVIIYALSYIPFIKCEGGKILTAVKNQTDMFVYHSKTVLSSTHPYSSKWYEWIIMKRPIWYYSGTVTENLKEGISAFGNPLVWWLGIPAVIFVIYKAVIKKDSTAIFLTVGYLAQLIPWLFVDRVVFIYHYFPCVPFVVLCIGYCIDRMEGHDKNIKYAAFLYGLAVIVLFALFYPVLSGLAINPLWVDKFLRWFASWVLI